MVSATKKKKKWTRKSPGDGSRKQINYILIVKDLEMGSASHWRRLF